MLLLGLQGFMEKPQPRRHFSAEERSSTLRGDGNGDAEGHNPGWEHLNGAGVALWALGTSATPIAKHWRMLRDADVSPDLILPDFASGKAEEGKDLMPCFMAQVKLPHLHQQLPGSHVPIRHRRQRDATPGKCNKLA